MAKLEHYRICGYIFTLSMLFGTLLTSNVDEAALLDQRMKNGAESSDCYYTLWNVYFQITYAVFGLYCDIKILYRKGQKESSDYTMKLRTTVFSALIYPSAWYIGTSFWTMYMYDRSLIFPEYLDKYVSKTTNFVLHAGIIPVVLWEMAFLPMEIPKSHKNNVTFQFCLVTVYALWVTYRHSETNYWPYPILEMIAGTIYYPLFYVCAFCLVRYHYYLQWPVRRLIWGTKSDIKLL